MKDYYLNKLEIEWYSNRPKHEFKTSIGPELRTFEAGVLFDHETGAEFKRYIPEYIADDEKLVYLVGCIDPFIVKGV